MSSPLPPKEDKDNISVYTNQGVPVETLSLVSPDPEISKKLVRKLDLIVLPLLAIIYFTHSLDRANLGNAKTDGFEKDIGLKDNQYSLILILFYIPYGKVYRDEMYTCCEKFTDKKRYSEYSCDCACQILQSCGHYSMSHALLG
jgi:hypothetical protein